MVSWRNSLRLTLGILVFGAMATHITRPNFESQVNKTPRNTTIYVRCPEYLNDDEKRKLSTIRVRGLEERYGNDRMITIHYCEGQPV